MSELNFLDTGGNKQKITTPVVNSIAFNTANTERVRIDSSGRVLIGTTTEGHAAADNLTVADTGNSGITIRSGTSNNGTIYFSDGTSGNAEFKGAVRYTHSDNALGFYSNGGEKLRITSEGYVTQPNRPAFSTNAQTSGFSSNSPNFLTPSARINNGNYYNASNGRFTVPIDGTYFFFFSYAGDNGVAAPVMYFAVNGSDSGPGQSCYYTAYQGAYTGQLYTLSEGDYVNASAKDWNGATPDPWNTYWGGWLLY